MLVREKPKLYRSRINREEIAPETYRKLFRFDKENVEWLAHRFIPEHDEKRGGCLTTVESMEATLHYLVDPGYQTTVFFFHFVLKYVILECYTAMSGKATPHA